jgi:hypothetical protein
MKTHGEHALFINGIVVINSNFLWYFLASLWHICIYLLHIIVFLPMPFNFFFQRVYYYGLDEDRGIMWFLFGF